MATKRQFGDLYRDKGSTMTEVVHYILLMQNYSGSRYWQALVLGGAIAPGKARVVSYFKPSARWYERVSE